MESVALIFLLLAAAACIALYLGVKKYTEHETQKNAQQILDQTFDGSETATYKVGSPRHLKFDQVLVGAEKRGYKLHVKNQESKKLTTLVFKKAS